MTGPYSPDDDVDLGAVSRDDALVELLRTGGAPGPDDDDAALDALSALLADVSDGLPEPGILPVRDPAPAQVLPLRRRRAAPRVALVAAAGVGLLSVGGVAAAAPGTALRPVRDAVSSAVSDAVSGVVGAVTTDDTPTPSASPSASPSPRALPSSAASPTVVPGAPRPVAPPSAGVRPSSDTETAAVARSRTGAARARKALDRAEAFLHDGRAAPARAQLDVAAAALRDVRDSDGRADLQRRLDVLRTQLRALTAATPSASAPGSASATPSPGTKGPRGSSATPSPRRAKASKSPKSDAKASP
ncbi:MAG: hypothetical protein JWM64_1498, partial [Frankiales bacterium]|nr:hypothetical protein [Frankiales bacterium]